MKSYKTTIQAQDLKITATTNILDQHINMQIIEKITTLYI